MVADLIRALLAALAAGVAPGYFWAAVLRPASGLAERLTYSAALSMASVPTLWVALVAVGIVFVTGVLAFVVKGVARGDGGPLLSSPRVVRDPRVLLLIAGLFALALATMLHLPAPGWLLLVIAAGLVLAGALAARSAPVTGPAGTPPASGTASAAARGGTGSAPPGGARAGIRPGGTGGPADPAPAAARTLVAPAGSAASAEPGGQPGPASAARPARPGLRDASLAVVLALTAYRAFRRGQPRGFRGGDQFSHAVMAEQMLTHGSYGSYLIYPPGFPALTAVICRFCGLTPLELFPVLAPTLLVLCAAGAYTLASGLWGWPYGIAAAGLNGLVLSGAYAGFAQGRYPDLVAAFFLLVMVAAALITLYQSPTSRSGVLVTVVAASVVLYHSVATLYAAVLLALVAVTALPYLYYRRERRAARVLLLTLGAVAILAACCAASPTTPAG